jgi:hypothetical protein
VIGDWFENLHPFFPITIHQSPFPHHQDYFSFRATISKEELSLQPQTVM